MGRPNVLLVVLDAVRAHNLSAYGHHRETTPFLSAYADRATLYRQARSPGIHSVASHASLWTGDHVAGHGVVEHEDQLREGTTVWEELGGAGYETGVFTTNPVVAHASNLSTQFGERFVDEFVDTSEKLFPEAHGPADVVRHEGVVGNLRRCLADDSPGKALANSAHHFYRQRQGDLTEETTSEDVVDAFLEWSSGRSTPWAACINLMDAHYPYEPDHDEWAGGGLRAIHDELERPPANEFVRGRPWWQLGALESLYDGAIRDLDAHVERLVSTLEDRGEHDDTLVVVTADHGEGFGEVSRLTGRTRMVAHAWGIHERLVHVPLVVSYPGQTAGAVVDEPATLTAFPDTVRAVGAIDGDGDGDVDAGRADDGSADGVNDRVPRDTFVPAGPVVVSTTRLREADDGIFEGAPERAADYYGPWRAVYESRDGVVHKTAERGGECVELEIRSAQDASLLGPGDPERVTAAFESLPDSDVKRGGQRDVDADVEEKLADLGYLR